MAGPVFQASGKIDFGDGLRMEIKEKRVHTVLYSLFSMIMALWNKVWDKKRYVIIIGIS